MKLATYSIKYRVKLNLEMGVYFHIAQLEITTYPLLSHNGGFYCCQHVSKSNTICFFNIKNAVASSLADANGQF